jgi:hypothetical protein
LEGGKQAAERKATSIDTAGRPSDYSQFTVPPAGLKPFDTVNTAAVLSKGGASQWGVKDSSVVVAISKSATRHAPATADMDQANTSTKTTQLQPRVVSLTSTNASSGLGTYVNHSSQRDTTSYGVVHVIGGSAIPESDHNGSPPNQPLTMAKTSHLDPAASLSSCVPEPLVSCSMFMAHAVWNVLACCCFCTAAHNLLTCIGLCFIRLLHVYALGIRGSRLCNDLSCSMVASMAWTMW